MNFYNNLLFLPFCAAKVFFPLSETQNVVCAGSVPAKTWSEEYVVRDKASCGRFFSCHQRSGGTWRVYSMECPEGTGFDGKRCETLESCSKRTQLIEINHGIAIEEMKKNIFGQEDASSQSVKSSDTTNDENVEDFFEESTKTNAIVVTLPSIDTDIIPDSKDELKESTVSNNNKSPTTERDGENNFQTEKPTSDTNLTRSDVQNKTVSSTIELESTKQSTSNNPLSSLATDYEENEEKGKSSGEEKTGQPDLEDFTISLNNIPTEDTTNLITNSTELSTTISSINVDEAQITETISGDSKFEKYVQFLSRRNFYHYPEISTEVVSESVYRERSSLNPEYDRTKDIKEMDVKESTYDRHVEENPLFEKYIKFLSNKENE